MVQATQEFIQLIKDWCTKPKRPIYPDKEFDDPHTHFLKPNNKKELERILEVLIEKVDRNAITDWGNEIKKVLRYNDLVEIAGDYRGKFEIKVNGLVTQIEDKSKEKKILVYKSQEIYTAQHLHITAEGCEDIPPGLDARATIEKIHKLGGLAYIEHPFTKNFPILQYWFVNNKEIQLTKELFELADGAEIFNSMNTLWMFLSNAKAKEFINNYNKHNKKITAVAGTDMHYVISQVGQSGIYLPRHDIQSLTDKEIIQLKRKDLHEGNIELFTHYTAPWTFFKAMFLS